MTYKKEIIRSMKLISKNKKSIFIGQSVSVPGNLVSGLRIEFVVVG